MADWTPPEGVEPPEHAPEAGVQSLKLPENVKNKTPLIGRVILDHDRFARDASGQLWVYRNGVYRPDGERAVRQRLRQLTLAGDAEIFSRHRANEVASWIEADVATLWEWPPLDVVNVENGLLDLKTGKLRNHTPEHLSPVRLPVVFRPDATCPAWEWFIREVMPEDAQNLVWELAAWLMAPDPSIQRAVLLLGDGSNGKSSLLRALTAFLGTDNVSSLTLQSLETNRFATARLFGRLANICADLPSDHLKTTSVFKAVTGGDRLLGEHKFGQPFEFRPYARFVFSANQLPRSQDESEGYFRRWLVVPLSRVFIEGKDAVPGRILDARLADPEELSGVLCRAVAALADLRQRGAFQETESIRLAGEEFRATTDPQTMWLNEHLVEGPDLYIAKPQLHRAYVEDCQRRGADSPSESLFAQRLLARRPGLRTEQRTIAGKRQRCWIGIGLGSDRTDDCVRKAVR